MYLPANVYEEFLTDTHHKYVHDKHNGDNMANAIDPRFSRFLIAKITRLTTGEDGNVTIWFQKPNDVQEVHHKVTEDKLTRRNCYGDLIAGHCYIIDLDSYIFKPKRRKEIRHHIWVDCQELRDETMMKDFFRLYSSVPRNTDPEDALVYAAVKSGYKTWLKDRIKKQTDDLFKY